MMHVRSETHLPKLHEHFDRKDMENENSFWPDCRALPPAPHQVPAGSAVNLYADNDGRFPDDDAVMVRFPLPSTPVDTDRSGWPWAAGHVLGQCGPNEWHIVVDGPPELAEPDPDDPRGPLLFPACFRDGSELRHPARG